MTPSEKIDQRAMELYEEWCRCFPLASDSWSEVQDSPRYVEAWRQLARLTFKMQLDATIADHDECERAGEFWKEFITNEYAGLLPEEGT